MRRRLAWLAVPVCAVTLMVAFGAGGAAPAGQDPPAGPQLRADSPRWPAGPGVDIGEQRSTWWPVSSAHDLRTTGIDVIATPGIGPMVVDGAGMIWVDVPWGLVRLDPTTGSARAWDVGDDAAFAAKWFVRASSGSGVWLVQGDRARLFDGVRIAGDIQVPSEFLGEEDEDLGPAAIRDLVEVGSELWIADPAGVARSDGLTWAMVDAGLLPDVEELQLAPSGEVWARSRAEGPPQWSRFDGTQWEAIQDPPNSALDAIVWDPTGGIVAASGHEVLHHDGSDWRVSLRLPDEGDEVRAVAAPGEGTLWVVTWRGALLRSSGDVGLRSIAAPDGSSLTDVALSGDEVVVSSEAGVYRVVGDELEPMWSPYGRSAVGSDILDVVSVSGDSAWIVAHDGPGESGPYSLRELQVGRPDAVLNRGLPASAAQLHEGRGSAAVAASDGALWYVTDDSVIRIADGTEAEVARRAAENALGAHRLNVNVVAEAGGPDRTDPRPREIGPDGFAQITDSGRRIEQTLFGDGDIHCPDHWAHDLSLPVGRVRYTPTSDGVEITVSLTGAWPSTQYAVMVNTDEFCQGWEAQGVDPASSSLTTDRDGAGSVTLTYSGTSTDAPRPQGVGLLAGDGGAVWMWPTEPGWIEPRERQSEKAADWEGLGHLARDGKSTRVDLPAPARNIMSLSVGPGDHLWATVCEGDVQFGGWGPECPGGWRLMQRQAGLMHREAGWLPVAFPAADLWGLGASPDGGFWAILTDSIGQYDDGRLAHYREGRWTTVPDAGEVTLYGSVVTPSGSVCRTEPQGPTLVCVGTSLRVTRTPVAVAGRPAVAPDGAVWVTDGSALARLPIIVAD